MHKKEIEGKKEEREKDLSNLDLLQFSGPFAMSIKNKSKHNVTYCSRRNTLDPRYIMHFMQKIFLFE